jgi:hypothetical protein
MMGEAGMGENPQASSGSGSGSDNKFSFDGMPNPEDLHNHLKGLFDGKLGSFAKELIDELTDELKESLGMEDIGPDMSPKDVFQKLIRNPDKFMKIVKKVSEKFQEKLKRGDISQEEIMKEAGELLKKMKEMGGNSKQMNEMFQNMAKSMGGGGIPGMGKNMKVDTNALNRMMKSQDIKERMRAKLEQKKQDMQQQQPQAPASNYVLKPSGSNQFVYNALDSGKQEKSMLPPPKLSAKEQDAELDALVASIEAVGEPTKPSASSSSGKKNKKNKK